MTPVERLNLSRERLRAAMLPPPPEPPGDLPGGGIAEFVANLAERLKTIPGLGALIEPIEAWWAQHPLRAAGVVAAEASRKLTTPMAERHPLALLAGAALLGALMTVSRPWRWLVSPALLASVLPSLASRTLRELPVKSWLKVLASLSEPRAGSSPSVSHPASSHRH